MDDGSDESWRETPLGRVADEACSLFNSLKSVAVLAQNGGRLTRGEHQMALAIALETMREFSTLQYSPEMQKAIIKTGHNLAEYLRDQLRPDAKA